MESFYVCRIRILIRIRVRKTLNPEPNNLIKCRSETMISNQYAIIQSSQLSSQYWEDHLF